MKKQKPCSEETRRKISEAHKERGTVPPSQKGVLRNDEWRKKQSLAHKGKKKSRESIEKMRQKMLGHPTPPEVRAKIAFAQREEKGNNWKGDKVGYTALHQWVYRQLGKADHCEHCGITEVPKGMKRYFEWSNISGSYKREVSDWQQLCMKCHKKFDKFQIRPRASKAW